MKKLLKTLAFVAAPFCSFSQTLQDGDLLFTSIQTDGTKQITFITFKDFLAGEKVYITDNAYNKDGTFRDGEGQLLWTSPNEVLPMGTTVELNEGVSSYTSNVGTVVKSGAFTPSASGDQLLAYQLKDEMKIFIAGLNWGTGNSWITTGETSTTTSYLPEGLTSVLSFGVHKDNGVFNCPQGPKNRIVLRASILDIKKWTLNDDLGLSYCKTIEIDDLLTALESTSSLNWNIFPNPINNGVLKSNLDLGQVKIMNVFGEIVLESESTTEINVSTLEKGIYFLQSINGNLRFIID